MIISRSVKKNFNNKGPNIHPSGTPIQFPSKCYQYFQFLSLVFYLTRNHLLDVMLKDEGHNQSIWLRVIYGRDNQMPLRGLLIKH